MLSLELSRHAWLVFGIHAPLRSTVAECLARWSALDDTAQAHSFLVVEGDAPGDRQTIAGPGIAALANAPARRPAANGG
jgi:hypothetical protein